MKKSTAVVLFVVGTLLVGGKVVVSNRELIIAKIADAIAYAEGFYLQGSIPNRLHNPGDLTVDITGRGIGKDGMYVLYSNDADGWDALRHQIRLMFSGSRIYSAGMTIAEVASKYTTTQQSDWALNVARRLGVSTSTKLSDIV